MNQRDVSQLQSDYLAVKFTAAKDWKGRPCSEAIRRLVKTSLEFLERECKEVSLLSLVPKKSYLAFSTQAKPDLLSRPANSRLFVLDSTTVDHQWDDWFQGNLVTSELERMSYTASVAPCLAMELFDRQNKKGPATYFECLVGHVFSRRFDVLPSKAARLPVGGRSVRLTMDFIFEGDQARPGHHLAVKMSTRERVVQAWAHQSLLDRAYGTGKYLGMMVLFSETKLDLKKREVVEICVPEQWIAYQSLLSRMEVIYYLDIPARYAALAEDYPQLFRIEQFGSLFSRK